MSTPLFESENLTIQYETANGMLTAVSNASFVIKSGKYFGLVGESGCGKSTIAKTILGILDENGHVESGMIRYKGENITNLTDKEISQKLRWKEISYIPQSSMNSLDPLQRISDQALEIGQTHTDLSNQEILGRFGELFEVVGLPAGRIDDYPYQFSGGMQQRAIIALALFLSPSLVIADEPTTALDVIMQDQIFKYLDHIREINETSMMLITHDISLVFESCDTMAIMHGGQVAETGSVTELFDSPRHPYSLLLQGAFPNIHSLDQELGVIEGHPPQSMGCINYCTFADRCPWVIDDCRQSAPELESVNNQNEHQASCFRKNEVYQTDRAESIRSVSNQTKQS